MDSDEGGWMFVVDASGEEGGERIQQDVSTVHILLGRCDPRYPLYYIFFENGDAYHYNNSNVLTFIMLRTETMSLTCAMSCWSEATLLYPRLRRSILHIVWQLDEITIPRSNKQECLLSGTFDESWISLSFVVISRSFSLAAEKTGISTGISIMEVDKVQTLNVLWGEFTVLFCWSLGMYMGYLYCRMRTGRPGIVKGKGLGVRSVKAVAEGSGVAFGRITINDKWVVVRLKTVALRMEERWWK
jgi:hypothetical protein